MNILEQANDIIYGDRDAAYGPYEVGASRFIAMVNTYLDQGDGKLRALTVADAPSILVMLKLSRLADNNTHFDSWLDIAGYAGCAGKLPDVHE